LFEHEQFVAEITMGQMQRTFQTSLLVMAGLMTLAGQAHSADVEQAGLRPSASAAQAGRVSLGERILSYWSTGDDAWSSMGWTVRIDTPGDLRHSGLQHGPRDAGLSDNPAVQRAALSSVYFSSVAGLRATGGVLGLSRQAALRLLPVGALGASTSFDRPGNLGASDGGLTLPYVGLGYSNRWLAGPTNSMTSWGFSADLGLMAASPRSAVRLGQQALDDTVRDLHLAPLLQLGVSYSF
jgi:hypothetical protein